MRAPFQILVFPFYLDENGNPHYAIFKRADGNYWQAIAGGGEDAELPIEAAQREAREEAGLHETLRIIPLDSTATIPVTGVTGEFFWGPDIYVIPEYCFGFQVAGQIIRLSHEHTEYRWLPYEEAQPLLHWHSNRNALWELHERLLREGE